MQAKTVTALVVLAAQAILGLAEDCPRRIGELPGESATSVAADGNRAVTAASSGLRVVDVTDPTNPMEVGAYHPVVAWGAECVELAGVHAFVCDEDNDRVIVLDISDEAAVLEVAEIAAEGVNDVKVARNYAYVAARELLVVDVSDPEEPNLVATVNHSGGAGAYGNIAVELPFLYLSQWADELWAGLRIFDISDPTQPTSVGTAFEQDFYCCGPLAVTDGWVYVGNNLSTLHVVDARHPEDAVAAGYLVFGFLDDLAIEGISALVLHSEPPRSVVELDLTDPGNPAIVDSGTTAARYGTIAADGGIWYVVGAGAGLEVFEPCGASSHEVRWVEIAAHGAGASGSQWRTDVVVRNLGLVDALLELTLYAGRDEHELTTTVGAREQAVFEDVVGMIGVEAKGALAVRSDQPLSVLGRIYTEQDHGTLGQSLNGQSSREGLSRGETAWLHGLRQLEQTHRTNLSITNTGDLIANVRVTLYDTHGIELTSFDIGSIRLGEVVQELEPLANRAGRTDVGWAMAKIEVLSGSGVFASASVIDSRTNDPTTVAMVKEARP